MSTSIIPELTVENIERSIQYYTENLGFRVVARAPETGLAVWVELSFDGEHIMFQEKEEVFAEITHLRNQKIGGTMLLVIRTSGAEVVRKIWDKVSDNENAVLPIHETDYGAVEFCITDPDGYVLIFTGR